MLLTAADIEVAPTDRVVEIGCGVGRLTRVLSERAASVKAIDVSAEMLVQAQEHNGHLENVEWIEGDGTSLDGIPLARPIWSSHTWSSSTSQIRRSHSATSARWGGCSSRAGWRGSRSRTSQASTSRSRAWRQAAGGVGSRAEGPDARGVAGLGGRGRASCAPRPRTAAWTSRSSSARARSTCWSACAAARPSPARVVSIVSGSCAGSSRVFFGLVGGFRSPSGLVVFALGCAGLGSASGTRPARGLFLSGIRWFWPGFSLLPAHLAHSPSASATGFGLPPA